MKTRREFFKLFGKVALVSGVVVAVPGVVLALPMELDTVKKLHEAYPAYTTNGYVQFDHPDPGDYRIDTTSMIYSSDTMVWTTVKDFYEGVR